ncbi:MAG: cell envelope integrity protein TolA, partial [Gammaproteobacteria bacterium]
ESKKKEEERQKKEEERLLKEELAAEEADTQRQVDALLIDKIKAEIYDKVSNKFNKTGLPENLKCALRVKLLPNGEIIDVSVAKSSNNSIFDRRAITAVQKASPLPVPTDIATFERLKLRDITFTFAP